jgi:hypothetical protein
MPANQRQIDEYVAANAAAKILGVTTARLGQLVLVGRIPYLRTDLGRLYRRSELEDIARTRQRKPGRPRQPS